VRIAFANLPYERCLEACQNLKEALTELVAHGPAILPKP